MPAPKYPKLAAAIAETGDRKWVVCGRAGIDPNRLTHIQGGRVKASEEEKRKFAVVLGKPVEELFATREQSPA